MTTPDTSVLIAGFDSSHTFHEPAQEALAEVRREGRLIAHTIAETFAVLTAAGPYDIPAAIVGEYLERFLGQAPIGLQPQSYPGAMAELSKSDITGGALYDGLIALAAREARATLVSLDRRAGATYRRVGVEPKLLL